MSVATIVVIVKDGMVHRVVSDRQARVIVQDLDMAREDQYTDFHSFPTDKACKIVDEVVADFDAPE